MSTVETPPPDVAPPVPPVLTGGAECQLSPPAASVEESRELNTQGFESTVAPADCGIITAEFIDDSPTSELPAPRAASAAVTVSAAEPPVRELIPGTILRSRYILQEIIGRGGDSVVFRAEDRHRAASSDASGGSIAIKALLAQQRHNLHAFTRLKREFRQMQMLTHPGIARVFDLDCDGDLWFMSMERVAGRTVNARMQGWVGLTQGLKLIAGCCEALEHAHSLGIIHGDLKPSNVLVTQDDRIKLIDFGSTCSVGDRTGGLELSLAATASYASPQVLAGGVAEVRDDIFSLACLSYVILGGGKRPFDDVSALTASRKQIVPAPLPNIPAPLFAVIARGLAYEREGRQASVQAFMDELSKAHIPPVDRKATVSSWSTKWRTQPRIALIAVAAVLLLGITVALRQTGSESNALASEASRPAPAPARIVSAAAPSSPAVAEPAPADPVPVAPETPAAAAQPRVPGTISFESSEVAATESQPMVAIAIQRLKSTRGRASVSWTIESGTARPYVDYEPVPTRPVRFVEGQSARSLYIPLVRRLPRNTSGVPRTFTVALRGVAGGAAVGPVSRVTVSIAPAAAP